MALYSAPGFIDYDGVPALQPNSVDFNIETDNKDVNTLLLGRAGHSAGSKSVKASVMSAVPQAGPTGSICAQTSPMHARTA